MKRKVDEKPAALCGGKSAIKVPERAKGSAAGGNHTRVCSVNSWSSLSTVGNQTYDEE